MADFSKFRTSISGFNRSDVADYIETMAIEYKKELRRVKDANEKLEAEKETLDAELLRTKAELAAVKEELAAAQETLKQTQEEDASLQQQIESLAQEAAELAQRAEEAEARAAEAEAQEVETETPDEAGEPVQAEAVPEEADAASAQCLPEKELEAYRRAEAMERNALARAERLRSKLSQLCDGARTRYTDSGEELEALTQDLSSVLERMRDTIADLQLAFDETENAFDELQTMDAE